MKMIFTIHYVFTKFFYIVEIKSFLTLDDANVDDDGTAAVDAGDDRLLCLIYLKSMMAWGTSSSSSSPSSQVKT